MEFIAGKIMNQPSNQVIQIGRNQIGSDQKASISQVGQNFYCQSLGVHLDRKKSVHQNADGLVHIEADYPVHTTHLEGPVDIHFPGHLVPNHLVVDAVDVVVVDHFQAEHKLPQLFVLSDRRIELHENAEKM